MHLSLCRPCRSGPANGHHCSFASSSVHRLIKQSPVFSRLAALSGCLLRGRAALLTAVSYVCLGPDGLERAAWVCPVRPVENARTPKLILRLVSHRSLSAPGKRSAATPYFAGLASDSPPAPFLRVRQAPDAWASSSDHRGPRMIASGVGSPGFHPWSRAQPCHLGQPSTGQNLLSSCLQRHDS